MTHTFLGDTPQKHFLCSEDSPFSIDISFDLIDKLFSPLSAESSKFGTLIFSTSSPTPISSILSELSGQYNESVLKKLLELLSQLNFYIKEN